MRWDDIDLGTAIWTIPAQVAKNKKATPIPLTQPALSLIRRRWEHFAGEQWVFPSPIGKGRLVGLPKAWARVLRRARITNLAHSRHPPISRHGDGQDGRKPTSNCNRPRTSEHRLRKSLRATRRRGRQTSAGRRRRITYRNEVGRCISWTGGSGCTSLPKEVLTELQSRTANILKRHDLGDRQDIVEKLVDEVSWALAASQHKLARTGRGRPVDAPEKLVAALVPDVLKTSSIRGNWLLGDDGEIGIVPTRGHTQAALRQARKQDRETMSRPARTSDARRILGKIHRNDPLPKSDQNN